MTSSNGILLQGIAWLIFWLGPAYFLFVEDTRWGHNFALPITFVVVGLAYHLRNIACQLTAVITAFILVPTLLAFWPWHIAVLLNVFLLAAMIILYLIEKGRDTELIHPNPRFTAWLKIHLMTFAYLGLAHMSLTFFLVRWLNPGLFSAYLPTEHELSTTIFNGMLLVLVPLAIMERFVRKAGKLNVARAGFIWAVLMMIIPLLTINILGQ